MHFRTDLRKEVRMLNKIRRLTELGGEDKKIKKSLVNAQLCDMTNVSVMGVLSGH